MDSIYFDGTAFREFPLESPGSIIAPDAAVDMEKGIVTLFSFGGCRRFTLEGKAVDTVTHPDPKDKMLHTSDAFMHLFDGDTEKQNRLKEISASFGLKKIIAPDHITKYELSSCGSYIYLASENGFYVMDGSTGEILACVPEKYGVQNFEELAPGSVAIATWSGVKLYKLCET